MTSAFAVAHIVQVKEFHLWLHNLNATGCPYLQSRHLINPQYKHGHTLMLYALVYTAWTCSKHFDVIKLNMENTCRTHTYPNRLHTYAKHRRYTPHRRTNRPMHTYDYEQFNHSNYNIRYRSWNYRGCWHQTCPPIDHLQFHWYCFIPHERHSCHA